LFLFWGWLLSLYLQVLLNSLMNISLAIYSVNDRSILSCYNNWFIDPQFMFISSWLVRFINRWIFEISVFKYFFIYLISLLWLLEFYWFHCIWYCIPETLVTELPNTVPSILIMGTIYILNIFLILFANGLSDKTVSIIF